MVKITNARAAGFYLLVEMMSQKEALGTELLVSNEQSNQGIIKSVGPLIDPRYDFKVGDRVVLTGKHASVPNPTQGTDDSKTWLCINVSDVRAVLETVNE